MQLTRVEHRANDRVRLFFDDDDEPRLEIPADLLLSAGLAPGDELSPARLEELEAEAEVANAREAALSLLAHRARATEELRRRLRRKGFPDAAIERVIAWLDERDYLDDDAFAEAFVRDRIRLRPRGRFGLAQELRKKGIEAATAEAAIERVLDAEGVTELDLALQAAAAWRRKNRSALRKAEKSSDARRDARRRLYAHLARRGFASDVISEAVGRGP